MELETFIDYGTEVLRIVPLILAFYIPALMGAAILRERGEGYKRKSMLIFAIGFGLILFLQLYLRTVSAAQVIETISISLLQMLVALLLAFFTVYKLAD
ncbi:MAG: hypothetical protein H0V53_07160 [Rubrobacter sp.]|jgi:hypothetical protein|nr:hypothetical protein [Rubrobacter sp.]